MWHWNEYQWFTSPFSKFRVKIVTSDPEHFCILTLLLPRIPGWSQHCVHLSSLCGEAHGRSVWAAWSDGMSRGHKTLCSGNASSVGRPCSPSCRLLIEVRILCTQNTRSGPGEIRLCIRASFFWKYFLEFVKNEMGISNWISIWIQSAREVINLPVYSCLWTWPITPQNVDPVVTPMDACLLKYQKE